MRRPLPLLILLSTLSACSDGKVNETHEGRLEEGDQVLEQDGSYYDVYPFETKEGFQITITMEAVGEGVDPYLHLMNAETEQLAHNDDRTPGNTTAQIVHTAPADGEYFALANSLRGGAAGDYRITIAAVPPEAAEPADEAEAQEGSAEEGAAPAASDDEGEAEQGE